MESEAFVIGALVACPGVVALGALALGIYFFRKARESASSTAMNVIGGIFVVVALGIGTCYGALFLH